MKRKILSLILICILSLFSIALAEGTTTDVTSTYTYYFFHSSGVLHGHGVNEVARENNVSLATCCGSGGARFSGNNNSERWLKFSEDWGVYPNSKADDLRTLHLYSVPTTGARVTKVEPLQDNIWGTTWVQNGNTVSISFIPGMPVDGIVNGNNQIPRVKKGYGYNMYTTIDGYGDLHTSNAPVDNRKSVCDGTPYCTPSGKHTSREVQITNLLDEGGGIGLIFEYKFKISYTNEPEKETVEPGITLFEYTPPWKDTTDARSFSKDIGVKDISTTSKGYLYKSTDRYWEVKLPGEDWKPLRYSDLKEDAQLAYYNADDELEGYYNPDISSNEYVVEPFFTYTLPNSEEWTYFRLTISDYERNELSLRKPVGTFYFEPEIKEDIPGSRGNSEVEAIIEIKNSNNVNVEEQTINRGTIVTVEDLSINCDDNSYYNAYNRSWEVRVNEGEWTVLNFDKDLAIKDVYSRSDKTQKITINEAKAENPEDSNKSNLQHPKFTYLLSNSNYKYEFRLNIRDDNYVRHSAESWVKTDNGSGYEDIDPNKTNLFNIINADNDYITDRVWDSMESPVTVRLVPTDETKRSTSGYKWLVKEGDGVYREFSRIEEPIYLISHDIKYDFKLIIDGGKEETHYTEILPGNANVSVNIDSPSVIYLSSDDSESINIPVHMYDLYYSIIEELYVEEKVEIDEETDEDINVGETSSTIIKDIVPEYWDIYLLCENVPNGEKWILKSDGTSERYTSSSAPTISNFPLESTEANFEWKSNKESKTLKFTVIAKLKTNIGVATAQASTETIIVPTINTITGSNRYPFSITVIDRLAPDNAQVMEAGEKFNLELDYAETDKLELDADSNIFSGTVDKITINPRGEVKLAEKGDYDNATERINRIHVTAIHPDGTHSAKQDITIKPNWYFRPDPPTDGGGGNSALKLLSTRDLRWQNYYKTYREPYTLKQGVLLKQLYRNYQTGAYYTTSAGRVGVEDISQIKMGYAVELQLELSDEYANDIKNGNAKVVIKVNPKVSGSNVTMRYRDNSGEHGIENYQTITLSRANPDKDKFIVKPDSNYKKWTFVYYLPSTSYIVGNSSNTVDIYFDSIIAYKNGVAYFNYLDLAKEKYNWNGHVFTYRTDKNNLQDLGTNAN